MAPRGRGRKGIEVAQKSEFNRLTQGNMTVGEYASQFSALLAYVPHVDSSDRSKLSRFMQGLNRTICTLLVAGGPSNYADAVEKAKNVEQLYFGKSHNLFSHLTIPVLETMCRCRLVHRFTHHWWPYQPFQYFQQPKQNRFKGKEKQFKKKSHSGSSSSGSQHGGGSFGSPTVVFCDRCGGKHPSTQCSGVQGSCYVCGQIEHFARVCPNSGRQQFQQPQFGQGFRGPVPRPSVPTQSFQHSNYQPPRGPAPQHFPGPQQSTVHALTHDQAYETPGGVIAGYPGGFDASVERQLVVPSSLSFLCQSFQIFKYYTSLNTFAREMPL